MERYSAFIVEVKPISLKSLLRPLFRPLFVPFSIVERVS